MDVLDAVQALRGREVPFALATVVRREPPVSARAGDKAVIREDGSLEGWVGGSCAHAAVVTTALRALADGAPRLLVLDPAPETERRAGVDVFPMACHSGGTLEIYVEPFLPRARLVLMGASPVAETLSRLGAAVGYRVFVLDPVATRERFPDAEAVLPDLRSEAPFGGGEAFVLVSTMGHADEDALEAALARAPRYLAVVASRRRFAEIRRTLAARGVPAAALDRVKSPAGLDLGARRPEEIAVSVLAEVVQVRRSERHPETRGAAPSETHGSAASRYVVDPVCGMPVDTRAPAAVSSREGETCYFCCAGCRDRFEAEHAVLPG